jgi:hypothetical protein
VNWLTTPCKDLTYSCYEGRRAKSGPKRNLACWIYGQLYHARNDYMHGNAITDDRLVVKSSGRSLFMYTPSLYRLLLMGFLGIAQYGPFRPRTLGSAWYEGDSTRDFRFSNRQGTHEQALAAILKSAERI